MLMPFLMTFNTASLEYCTPWRFSPLEPCRMNHRCACSRRGTHDEVIQHDYQRSARAMQEMRSGKQALAVRREQSTRLACPVAKMARMLKLSALSVDPSVNGASKWGKL